MERECEGKERASDKRKCGELERQEEKEGESREHDRKPKGHLKVSGIFLAALQIHVRPPSSSSILLPLIWWHHWIGFPLITWTSSDFSYTCSPNPGI